MKPRSVKKVLLAAVLCPILLLGAFSSSAASAAEPAPAWKLALTAMPSVFRPGSTPEYLLLATNVGAKETTTETTTLEIAVPAGIDPIGFHSAPSNDSSVASEPDCEITGQRLLCEISEPLHSGFLLVAKLTVEVPLAATGQTIEASASVSGGGATAISTTAQTEVSDEPPGFEVLPGSRSIASEADGSSDPLAGSHPYQQTISFDFPTESVNGSLSNAGQPHEIVASLPPGFLGDPAATPVLCTEAELTNNNVGCPAASQVGVIDLTTLLSTGGEGGGTVLSSPLFNMVPPPGAPAELAFDAAGVGIFIHLRAGLRSDSDYGIKTTTSDVLALGLNPIFGIEAQIWGDPSAAIHDHTRGVCFKSDKVTSCPVAPQQTAFFTLGGSCPASPPLFSFDADSWEDMGSFAHEEAPLSDLGGNPLSISGCNQLSFEPTITAQPTTNLADSPSGLDVDLHQPQDFDKEHQASAALKNATVTLPEGLVANPSQASGLGSCSQDQIGYLGEGHYSKDPQGCPDSSKLGTVEVTSPLVAEYKNEGTEVVKDPETGEPIPRPLPGALYLAKPFENQFGSLLAIYLTVEDPQSGIVSKLAGKVIPDPSTGQLTTVFEENPQLPLEDVKLHLFGGARASLTTPVNCGAHTTTTTLTPWSTPEGVDAHPEDSFQTTQEPGGGSCPSSEGGATNKPAFSAGTLEPVAGAYSPFVLKLSREDGSQRIAGVDTLLPPGLSGKLAGIGQCSEAQIAQAKAREKPNQGALEQAGPSCPASSEVGAVDVTAGSGPTPFHTTGHAYLAGPYKGAPLSLAVIVPAVAGPFDLGAVVSRVALHVEPESAQIHAISDPLPQILEGIPLDVRSISIQMARSQFTLNPTSCDPMQVSGSAISALGGSAALTSPFQVGGCPQLPFKPKLSLRLKGGTKRASHPKLIASLKAKPGEANVASAQVKLPPSAFLDQAHIRTVCTRVQFAANACPKGSIYGKASATTPLLAYPLAGNVYLRSSNHKLPDLVVALKGPDYQPIEIDLDGKTDSVKGALRNTFEAVPDAPVSSFRLELFGGKRGLVINSRNLCAHRYKAEVNLTGQNGKVFDTEPAVGVDCKGKGRKGKKGSHGR